MSLRSKKFEPERPAVDEWGIYDPEQAGLAAVLERLEARHRAGAPFAMGATALAMSMRDASELASKPKK